MKMPLFLIACLFSLTVFAQEKVLPAETILSAAYQRAKKENKNVIVIFHASWCSWCKKMDASMNDEKCKKFFDDNYVTAHLTVEESKDKKDLENPGAAELKLKYHGDKTGIPFWLVLDKDGKLLADSFTRRAGVSLDEAGQNMGCPATEEEVAAFVVILKKTSHLSTQNLDIIEKRFKENKAGAH